MLDFSVFAQFDTYVSLFTLTLLEIVLGVDNIIFITILAGKIPDKEQEQKARRIGLGFALISRLVLLSAITWVMQLKTTLFTIGYESISGKDLILILGGLFLLAKATHEIHENVQRPEEHQPQKINEGGSLDGGPPVDPAKFMKSFIIQVIILDIVFSLDSVITAVGMVSHLSIMVTAVIIAVIIMMKFAGPIGDFVQQHASIRLLALSFLVLIGVLLIAEGFGQHISKGYVYFAMAFALGVELLNMRMHSRAERMHERQQSMTTSAVE